MKPTMLLLLMMLLASSAFAQKKGKVDPKDVRIDSLTQVTHALTMQLDSVSKQLTMYHGVYDAVKTKVIKYDFKPERTGALIDSLRTSRDASFSGLNATSAALTDTVATLRAENAKLQATIAAATDQAAQKATAIADLKELKGLLDQKIITQAEFDSRKAKLVEKL
jgi:septal ring factor EnvC (AmiA/AmiB activator)